MELFLKILSGVLIIVILSMILSKQGKEFSVLVMIAGSCIVMIATYTFVEPIIVFLRKLATISKINNELIVTLLKCVGIGLLAELTGLICADSGNSSLGKTVRILSGAVILWLSLPVYTQLIELIENILGAI